MSKNFVLVLATYVLLYAALEAAYLGLAAKAQLRSFAATGARTRAGFGWAALGAYVALFVTVYYFLVRPIAGASSRSQLPSAARTAADATLLAVAIYGVYNLTNFAVLDGLSPTAAATDVLWGVTALNLVGAAVRGLQLRLLS
jgi:uncharacterized membrane protein